MHARPSLLLKLSLVVLVASTTACEVSGTNTPGPPASGPPSDAVAILVVDDFDAPNAQKTLYGPTGGYGSDGECIVTSTGSQVAGGRGAGGLPPGVAHGPVVYNEIVGLLKQAGLNDATGSYRSEDFGAQRSWVRRLSMMGAQGAPPIVIVAVDTEVYQATEIREHLTDLTTHLKMPTGAAHPGRIVKFVLNLSFEVIPCDFVKNQPVELDPVRLQLARYLQLVKGVDGEAALESLFQNLVNSPPTDWQKQVTDKESTMQVVVKDKRDLIIDQLIPKQFGEKSLGGFLADSDGPTNDERVIPVAAAGNGLGASHIPLSFPFAPAVWPSVVSVSADPLAKAPDGTEGTSGYGTAWYSNSGEVRMSGTLEANLTDGLVNHPVYGTSFAAPLMSVQEAFYLVHNGQVNCTGAKGNSVPPLGYQSDTDHVWLNLIRSDADNYCTDFPNLAKYP